jgi:hypothetical protein
MENFSKASFFNPARYQLSISLITMKVFSSDKFGKILLTFSFRNETQGESLLSVKKK